ncbi:MAG: ribbon-helix-helix protein, CopG family [Gammaproteobacteria bacterium]|nr:ribbon-helix-helix protein, CopG family [Gammaproteobacteria bacterium]
MGVTSIRLQAEIEAPLEELAGRLDRSKNYLINQAIKEFIARQGLDEIRWQETLTAIGSVTEGAFVEEQDVAKWLESWGTEQEADPPSV